MKGGKLHRYHVNHEVVGEVRESIAFTDPVTAKKRREADTTCPICKGGGWIWDRDTDGNFTVQCDCPDCSRGEDEMIEIEAGHDRMNQQADLSDIKRKNLFT
jgi:DnaJ-class molecular chaperone